MANDRRLAGSMVVDASAEVVGVARSVLVDSVSGRGNWLQVALVDGPVVLLPLAAASLAADGRVVVPFGVDVIRSAPAAGLDSVSEADANLLLEHYGMGS